MKQLINFVPSKGGTQAGYCLRNVRLGFGIPALYNDAWQAWKNTKQHTSAIPTGVDVPLYYDYTDRKGNRYGHINVRLKDGRIWNDGRYYNSLTSFQNSMSNVKYVGWSDAVNNVKVIEEGEEMLTNRNHFITMHQQTRGKNPSEKTINDYVGKKTYAYAWHKLHSGVINLPDTLKALATEKNKTTELGKAIVIKDKEIANLKAKLAAQSKDTENLNKLGETLVWLLTRLGVK